jgi:ribose transport system substrate-binding protein
MAFIGESAAVTIGVTSVTFESPYASAMVKNYAKYCEEKGYELIMLDANFDIQKEAQNIDALMAKKVDIIIVVAVDSEGSKAGIKKAVDAGFTVICSNATINDPEQIGLRAYTGPNYYSQAVVAAREAIRMKNDANAVMITGTPGYSAAEDRRDGFTDTVAKEAPDFTMLDIQSGNWMREDTQRVMSDYITKYGDEIELVYTHDDNMTVGAINALKAAGYTADNRPFVVSIGGMADGLPAVKDGWIDVTCQQSPILDAQLSIDVAVDIINGKQAEAYKEYFMDTPVIDKSNVQEIIDMGIWD